MTEPSVSHLLSAAEDAATRQQLVGLLATLHDDVKQAIESHQKRLETALQSVGSDQARADCMDDMEIATNLLQRGLSLVGQAYDRNRDSHNA